MPRVRMNHATGSANRAATRRQHSPCHPPLPRGVTHQMVVRSQRSWSDAHHCGRRRRPEKAASGWGGIPEVGSGAEDRFSAFSGLYRGIAELGLGSGRGPSAALAALASPPAHRLAEEFAHAEVGLTHGRDGN